MAHKCTPIIQIRVTNVHYKLMINVSCKMLPLTLNEHEVTRFCFSTTTTATTATTTTTTTTTATTTTTGGIE